MNTAKICALGAAVVMTGLAAFELALAAGVPWGNASFGGAPAVLPTGLRVAAVAGVAIWGGAALIVLRRAGYPVWAPLPDRALPVATWVIAGYAGAGVLLNAASPSEIERAIMVPVALTISVLTFGVAISSRRRSVLNPSAATTPPVPTPSGSAIPS